MNVQSESSEIIGGFKPLDVKKYIQPIYDQFSELFTEIFPDPVY